MPIRRRSRAKKRKPSNPKTNKQAKSPSKKSKSLRSKELFIEGRVQLHPKGFGFLAPSDGGEHFYITADSLMGVMNRDTIIAKPIHGTKADCIRVSKRNQKEFLGEARKKDAYYYAIPSNPSDRRHQFRIEDSSTIKEGQSALFTITDYPNFGRGKVVVKDIIENINIASNDTLKVLIDHSWPRDFSAEAVNDAKRAQQKWLEKVDTDRKDLRDLAFVTIDGKDSRDFDDAVFAKKEKSSTRLWVAIADVSHFVQEGGPLDKEAFERSTSVYFPDFVVPMLPEELSNDICSLNPEKERAALVCEMLVNHEGICIEHKFFPALIKSHQRLTYEDMQGFMDKEDWAVEKVAKVATHLQEIITVYKNLRGARSRRNAVELDIAEAAVHINKEGEVIKIAERERLEAHRLIEECMLVANQSAAEFLSQNSADKVYRVHESPDPQKFENLLQFLELNQVEGVERFRVQQKGNKEPDSKSISKAFFSTLDYVSKKLTPDDHRYKSVQSLALRCMSQARYSKERLGHFALALEDYTHFTSPIRRYPDLIVHRLIKGCLIKKDQKKARYPELASMLQHCSDQERVALDCERTLIDIKKCRFLEKHIGDEFDTRVTSINENGIFCQIEGQYIDGFVPVERLQEKFRMGFKKEWHVFENSKKERLQIGSYLRILVVSVDVETRRIQFEAISLDSQTKD